MVLASMLEVMTIGAVIPFIGILSNPSNFFEKDQVDFFINIFGLKNSENLILIFSIIFCLLAFFSGAVRLYLLYSITRISFLTSADLSVDIYQRVLSQPYAIHVNRSSSEVIDGIASKANAVTTSAILPVVNLLTAGMIFLTIVAALLYMEPILASIAIILFSTLYFLVIKFTKKQLAFNSHVIANQSPRVIRSLQEGLGGIREILISGSQNYYCEIYRSADLKLKGALGSNQFISAGPRYAIESFGIIFIGLIAYFLTKTSSGFLGALPALGVLALGAQRILPNLQQIYGSWTSMKGAEVSLGEVLDLLDQPKLNYGYQDLTRISFAKKIELSEVSFFYGNNDKIVLKNINLTINKGEKVGFIGVTGSGKSTLLDIIMGLFHPASGSISIDGIKLTEKNYRNWQLRISHVPQTIFMSDASVLENIAFGISLDQIDLNRAVYAAKLAQLHDVVMRMSDGYNTQIGEMGVRLSGGQRQRVGIARALYKESDVLILDEATSALDDYTEKAVVSGLDAEMGKKTILMIAHRISSLKNCDVIYEVQDGSCVKVTYDDILKR